MSYLTKTTNIQGVIVDLFLAVCLLDANNYHQGIENIAVKYDFKEVKTTEEVYGKGTKKEIPNIDLLAQDIITKN